MTADMRPLTSIRTAGLLVVVVLATARAQEPGSRAEEQARQQEEKARALKPYKEPWIERQLLAIEDAGGFGAARGLFLTFGDVKRGSGFAMGPAYGKTFASGAVVVAKGAYAFSNAKMAQLSLQSPALAGGRLLFKSRARWQDAPTVRVYALGMDSPKVKTEFAETKTEVSGEAALEPVRFVRLGAGVGVERFDTGISHKADPAHSDIFDRLQGVGADQRYVPILRGNWVLFLGLRASTTATTGGHAVPFFLMPDLGGNDLRGFANYRFRDLHSILITAEYRWY